MRILLVDDHTMFREGMVSLLASYPDMEVVGEAGTIKEAISMARRMQPETVLMDFELPDGSGIEATHAILADRPDTIVVFLTVYDTDDRLFAAILSGAKGYLLKNLPISKLVESLRGIYRNEAAISRVMTARVLNEFSRLGPPHQPNQSVLAGLTFRETEILQELATDATNLEIARRLLLSEATVKNHIHSILTKLNFKNRRDVARFARQLGLRHFNSK